MCYLDPLPKLRTIRFIESYHADKQYGVERYEAGAVLGITLSSAFLAQNKARGVIWRLVKYHYHVFKKTMRPITICLRDKRLRRVRGTQKKVEKEL